MLDAASLKELHTGKNLLAFSAGVDSSALFFLLKDSGIAFDIAIVNYNTRTQSKHEVAYAKKLAATYNKTLYIHDTTLALSDFEQQARRVRYEFFETIIAKHHYTHLITAHQLNDQLEWFMMQLSKGAGALELLGMRNISKRSFYTLVRPLLGATKAMLHSYNTQNNITFFIDETNTDLNHTRNKIRHLFSNSFLGMYHKGVAKSFDYLQQDNQTLLSQVTTKQIKELFIIQAPYARARIYTADKLLKKMGMMLSGSQKEALLDNDVVIAHRTHAVVPMGALLFVAPFVSSITPLPKAFKEACRTHGIPKHIRAYIYQEGIELYTI